MSGMAPLPGRSGLLGLPKAAAEGAGLAFEPGQLGITGVLGIHPGMAIANHAGIDITAGHMDPADQPPIAIAGGDRDPDLPLGNQSAQSPGSLFAIGLVTLRGIQLPEANPFDLALFSRNREGIAIDDAGDTAVQGLNDAIVVNLNPGLCQGLIHGNGRQLHLPRNHPGRAGRLVSVMPASLGILPFIDSRIGKRGTAGDKPGPRQG